MLVLDKHNGTGLGDKGGQLLVYRLQGKQKKPLRERLFNLTTNGIHSILLPQIA